MTLRLLRYPYASLRASARNDDESVSPVTSLAMTSERAPHNDGGLSPIYLNEVTPLKGGAPALILVIRVP